jgi:hypothetical protein
MMASLKCKRELCCGNSVDAESGQVRETLGISFFEVIISIK